MKAALIVPAPYDKGEITRNAMGNTASEERLAQMVQQIEMAQTMNASDIIHPGFIKQTNMMSSALRVRVVRLCSDSGCARSGLCMHRDVSLTQRTENHGD